MQSRTREITVPQYYQPWPHQQAAWKRRASGLYHYDIKLWCRQAGKDTDDIEQSMKWSWDTPGLQTAYVGLDNVWINNNIFKKYIDGRTFWKDYPEQYIDVKDTNKEVYFTNNPQDQAPSRIKFIGFLNDEAVIGSSYDKFFISEVSLYKRNAFQYLEPIWDRKLKVTNKLFVGMNGTPRGTKNVLYDFLKTYTGCDEPEGFPGAHMRPTGNVYVDVVKIQDIFVPDGHGGYQRLYTDEELEQLKDRYLRAYGNLNLYYQENECDFTVVNAGLVYQGIEKLKEEGRYRRFNLDSSKPVYAAFDISSKDKTTDATAGIIFQVINGMMFIYDIYEARGQAFVQCMADLSKRPYFHLIRFVALPWDSERSASSETPIEEARKMFPNINWHALSKERVDRGIDLVRRQMPNMLINSDNCEYLEECFMNYEYKRLEKADDWSPKPVHNKYSHLMDACFSGDTVIETLAGKRKFEEADEVGYVMTDDGFKPYWNLGVRKVCEEWLDIELESGETVSCTTDHVFPTDTGLKYAKDLSTSDSLRYNSLMNPSERSTNDDSCKDSRVEWSDLVSLSRREVLSGERNTPSPRCIQVLLRGNTTGLPCSSCRRQCGKQLTREFSADGSFRTLEISHVAGEEQEDSSGDRKEILARIGSQAQKMGEIRRRKSLVPTALERQYWQVDDIYRTRVCALPQDLSKRSKALTLLLQQLQSESSYSKIKRITRRRGTAKAWCLEVEGQFFYANNILAKNCRYGVMAINEMQYLQMNDVGGPREVADHYGGFYDDEPTDRGAYPITYKKPEKRTKNGLYYY